jgi:CheY-like chemotaxis protein
MLARLGYHVETKTSPVDALELFRSKPNHFDMVITDMMMPKMTGDILAKEILAVRPGIPIALCTGYSEKISKESAAEIGIQAFLSKPLVMGKFAVTVRNALDKGKK